MKQILLFLALLLTCILPANCQIGCINSYTQANLPIQCDTLTMGCQFISFTNSSLIVVNTTTANQSFIVCLNLPDYNVTFSEGTDNLELSVYVAAQEISLNSYSIFTIYDAVFISGQGITASESNITVGLIWMQAGTAVTISNSTLKFQQLFQTDCNCLDKGASCDINPYYFPFLFSSIENPLPYNQSLMNYTYSTWNFFGQNVNSIMLSSPGSINVLSSTLRISVIAMYSPNIIINSSIVNTTGLGFPSGTGYGCGYFNEVLNQLLGCSGTGGSYGGYGGNSSPQGCNLLFSNPPYSRELIPKYPGSGGGFFLREATEVSSGGGVINIQTETLNIYSSQILANGVEGIQGGAGGAGGSISVDYNQLFSSSSKMSANGGSGRSSGSGGRIRIWDQNWKTYSIASNSTMRIQILGGGQCETRLTCGENGSIISSPCPPGYTTKFATFMCKLCDDGMYQLSYGYGKCLHCYSKPTNSYYPGQQQSSSLSNYSLVCMFSCNQGYTSYNNQECLTNFQTILANVGGANLLICIGIVVASLIIFLIITMIRKLSYSDSNNLDQTEHIDYYKQQSYFKLEDIPFHQIRVYFQGDNTPQRPWKISENVIDNLKEFYEQNEGKVATFTRLFKELNQMSEYHKASSIVLFAIKILYYPLSLVLAQAFRQRKSKSIRNAVIARAKVIPYQQQSLQFNVGIKFHVNQLYTVGCLQIFNYSKQTLDFYIRNYFPMYFKLQRLLIGGYSIDSTDPLLKALFSEFQDRSQKKFQHFLIDLNQLLRNEDVAVFKHLWKITEIWPVLQCYLWQPPAMLEENNQMVPVQQAQLSGIMGMDNRLVIDKDKDLFLVFSIQGRAENSMVNPINQSGLEENKNVESKYSNHFHYTVDLPNIYFDEISCIRHRYNLREAMIEFDQRKNVFWEIDNSFSEKYLSWILGSISILSFLLNLFSFFLMVFLLVQYRDTSYIKALLAYFILFPLCEFFMIFIQFNLIVSKGSKIMSYSIYFTLFAIIKNIVITIILLVIAITLGFNDAVLFVLFLIWIMLLIFHIASLILQCMLNARLTKTK